MRTTLALLSKLMLMSGASNLSKIGEKMNILLVEDDRDTLDEVSELLDTLGHESVESECAEESLQYIRSGGSVDLIMFDLNMPGTSGLDMMREVRLDSSLAVNTLPAICMTGSKDAELVVDLLRIGIMSLVKLTRGSAIKELHKQTFMLNTNAVANKNDILIFSSRLHMA